MCYERETTRAIKTLSALSIFFKKRAGSWMMEKSRGVCNKTSVDTRFLLEPLSIDGLLPSPGGLGRGNAGLACLDLFLQVLHSGAQVQPSHKNIMLSTLGLRASVVGAGTYDRL